MPGVMREAGHGGSERRLRNREGLNLRRAGAQPVHSLRRDGGKGSWSRKGDGAKGLVIVRALRIDLDEIALIEGQSRVIKHAAIADAGEFNSIGTDSLPGNEGRAEAAVGRAQGRPTQILDLMNLD